MHTGGNVKNWLEHQVAEKQVSFMKSMRQRFILDHSELHVRCVCMFIFKWRAESVVVVMAYPFILSVNYVEIHLFSQIFVSVFSMVPELYLK